MSVTGQMDNQDKLELILPLEVFYTTNKKFILNLNNYRNDHYRILSDAKIAYKNLIWHDIPPVKFTDHVQLIYTIYPKRKLDISNACSIIDKFTCDVLTEKGVIVDDNFDHVKSVTYEFGHVDKINPHCKLIIKKYK